MIKTFEIDLDSALVESASEIFEALGTDIDTAIRVFLTQTTLRRGFPFDIVIPENETEIKDSEPELNEFHGGITEDEENALATATDSNISAPPAPCDVAHGDSDVSSASANESDDNDEEEDETAPDNLFDAWNVGTEEDADHR